MTTLDKTDGLAERLADAAAIFDRIQAQEGNNIDGDSEPHWSSQIEALAGAKACRDAIDALSSLPAQAVGVKRDLPPLDAQMGSLGDRPPDPPALNAHIVPVVRVAPSQPAAVGVTDEMVEAARQLYSDKVREYDRDFHSEMEALDWQAKYGSHLHSASRGERWAMKQVLDAALVHRDQVKL